MLLKFEFCMFKWHVENKKQAEYKRRVVVCYIIATMLPRKEIPLWFYDEYFQFLIWNNVHLGSLYPYSRSNVPTAMNEGPCAEGISKYGADNKKSFSFNPELLEIFFYLSLSQENSQIRNYILKKLLDAIEDKFNDVLLSKEIFWVVSRLKFKFAPGDTLEAFFGPHFSSFLVKLLIYDLQKDVAFQSNCRKESPNVTQSYQLTSTLKRL
jgi:hypothetical protein